MSKNYSSNPRTRSDFAWLPLVAWYSRNVRTPRGLFALIATLALAMGSTISNAQLVDGNVEGGFELPGGFAGNGWTVVNGGNNTWQTSGVGTPFAGTNHAFISNDGGATYGYSTSTAAVNHFYRDVAIPAGHGVINLSFQKKNVGEAGWDRLLVFAAPTSVTPVAGIPASASGAPNFPGATLVYTDPAGTPAYGLVSVSLPANYAGTTVRLIFTWQSDNSFGTSPGAAVDNINLTSSLSTVFTATINGGLWSQPATWVGGVVPTAGNDVVIPDASTVVADVAVSVRNLTVGGGTSGILQWGSGSFGMTVYGDLLIASGAKFHAHTTGGTGQVITVFGNLTNNGFANLAYPSSQLVFNGNTGSNLGGTGTFLGDGTRGIIRTLFFNSPGAAVISTTQNLTATFQFIHTAGSLNTNGKLAIDNTAAVFGQAINQQVMEIVMTNVGAGYTSAPTVTISAPTGTGITATAVANFVSGTVRSITITSPGDGYRSNPTVTLTGGGFTTAATATAVVVANIAGAASALTTRSAAATVSGGVTINSSQGVAGLVVASGGVGYTSAPTVGFGLPTNLNLVTACGSGYNAAPTVTATGGGGTGAVLSATVANGQITSIYVTTPGTGYTSEPTISITGGGGSGATAVMPAGTVPVALAAISNGMVSSFNVTNPGNGYIAAPAVTLTGGGFASAATTPSSKVGLYGLSLGFYTPAASNLPHTVDALYPSNRRLNQLTIGTTNANQPVTLTGGNWTIYGSITPLTLTSGNIDMSGNNLIFTFQTYAGIAPGVASYVTNGGVTLTSPGGSVTRTFPLSSQFQSVTGTGSNLTGSNITSLTCNTTGTASGAVSPSGNITGTKAFRLRTTGACAATAVYGTSPTAALSFIASDGIISDIPSLLVAQSTALTGPYTVRSIGSGSGPLGTTGSRTTATVAPGPITTSGDDYFAWVTTFVNIPMAYDVTRNTGISYTDISAGGIVMIASGANAGTTINVGSTAGLNVGDAISYVSGGVGAFAANTVVASIINATSFTTNVAPTTGLSSGARIYASALGSRSVFSGLTSADDNTSVIALTGTTFTHSSSAPTSMTVGNNGYITFNNGAVSSTFNNGMALSTRTIAPFWDDLISPGFGTPGVVSPWCFYQVSGGALGSGSAVITVQWTGMETYQNNGPNLNFQVKLYEGSNNVEFVYGVMQGFDGTIGVSGAYVYSYSCGMSNNLVTSNDPTAGQILNQLTENTREFSAFSGSVNNRGSNYMSSMPDCNSSILFTPGAYTPYIPGSGVPANDNPAGAIALTALAAAPANLCGYYFTSRGASPTAAPVAATCGTPVFSNNDDDVWFKFQCINPTTNVNVYSSGGYDGKVEIYADAAPGVFSGVPGALQICQNNVLEGLTEAVTATGLTIGDWYHVRVYHKHGGIQATATATVSGGLVTGITVTNPGSGYMNGAYGGAGVVASSRVRLIGGGGRNAVATLTTSGTNTTTGTVSAITVANAGSNYTSAPTVIIDAPNAGVTGDFAITVFATPPPAPNDEPCTAVNIVPANTCTPIVGSFTLGATMSLGYPACAGNSDDDVWYSWTCVDNDDAITVDGYPGFNAVVQVYSSTGVCPGVALTSVGCINSTGDDGVETYQPGNLVPGTKYYFRVFHQNGGGGSGLFTYCVTTPDCASNTIGGLVASGLTAHAADFDWGDIFGAIGYQWEIGLTGFTPGTLTSVLNGSTATSQLLGTNTLLSSTGYCFAVRQQCAPLVFGPWIQVCFTTAPGCGDTWYDTGGALGNYPNNADQTTTICPATPGDAVYVTFTSFSVELGYDGLYVYDGPSTASPLIPGPAGTLNAGAFPAGSWNSGLPNGGLPFISSHPSGCLTFRFRADGSINSTGWVAGIVCAPPPTCGTPTGLSVSGISGNSVVFNLTPSIFGTPLNYDYELQPQGIAQGTPGALLTGNTGAAPLPYTITGLIGSTDYSLYVRSHCGPGDDSGWAGPVNFATLPGCGATWYDLGGALSSYANNTNQVVTVTPVLPGDKVSIVFSAFDVENGYDAFYIHNGPSISDPIFNSGNPLPLSSFPAGGFTGSSLPGGGCPFVSSHPSGALTFEFLSDFIVNRPGWQASITCAPAPACGIPTNIVNTAITGTTATFSGVPSPFGTPSSYSWEVQPQGIAQGTPGGISGTSASFPITATGLSGSTQYTLYVRANCGGPLSPWSCGGDNFNFFTSPDCSVATVLACGATQNLAFQGAGAWNLGPGGTGAGLFDTDGRERIFSLVVPVTGTYTFTGFGGTGWVDYFYKDANLYPACDDQNWTYMNDILSTESFTQTLNAGNYYILCDAEFTGSLNQNFVMYCPAPPAVNDALSGALNSGLSGNGYPLCTNFSGSNVTATDSPEDTYPGADVWSKFVATSAGCRITMSSLVIDCAIELFDGGVGGVGPYVSVQQENVTGAGGTEIMNFGGLTEGRTYYVCMGSASNLGASLGTFTGCIQRLLDSRWDPAPIGGSGTLSICQAFKPLYAGANTYIAHFNGLATTHTGPTQFLLGTATGTPLQYGSANPVTVDAVFNLANGAGTPEVITVVSQKPVQTMNISAQPLPEVKVAQRCPATILRSTLVQATPFVCGAIDYRWEFLEYTACVGGSSVGSTFTVDRGAATPYLKMNFTLPTALTPGSYYQVRIAPIMPYGVGTYGPAQRIYISPLSPMVEFNAEDFANDLKDGDLGIEASLYPNPNSGNMVNLNIAGIDSDNVFVRITDGMGRVVFTNRYTVEGSLNTIVTFEKPLASGIYNVEFQYDGNSTTKRMVVQK
jgi:hypothetical protein